MLRRRSPANSSRASYLAYEGIYEAYLILRSDNIGSIIAIMEMNNFDIWIRITYTG